MEEARIRETIKSEAIQQVAMYNVAYKADDAVKCKELDKTINDLVTEYNDLSQKITFEALKVCENPMIAAINKRDFDIIKVKDKAVSDENKVKTVTRTIEEGHKDIDLLSLQKFIGHNIGKVDNWESYIEKLGMYLTYEVATEIGTVNKEAILKDYKLKKVAKEVDLGKNPCSKKNLLATVQGMVNAMIGEEYKAMTHDVNFLLQAFTKMAKDHHSIAVINDRALRRAITEICWSCINKDHHYDTMYKRAKQ